ncbi:MAG: GNVR domain-containing protein [Balneolales bacterium]
MSNQKDAKNEVNILDLILIMAKNKWFIFKIVFSITLLALIISLVWPKTYKSTAQFMPPVQQKSLGSGLGGMLGGLLPMQTSSEKIGSESILVVLRSRSLRERVIDKFNFREVYETDIMEELLKEIDSNTKLEEVREGGFGFNPVVALELSFIDRDPERAQSVTSFYLSELDSIVRVLNRMNADESFAAIEGRYHKNLEDLARAEEEFKEFQETYGILQLDAQNRAIVEALADLRSSSIGLELKINLLEQAVNPNNVELVNMKRSKKELDRKFDEMIKYSEANPEVDVFHPLKDMPDLGLQFMRKYREVNIQSKILEVVLPQYEQQLMMRLDDSRNIQIVDEASFPTYKHKPKRAIIVLAGMFFSFILSMIIIFVRESYHKDKNSESHNKLVDIMTAIKSKSDQR